MPTFIEIHKIDLNGPTLGTSTWLYGYSPKDFFLIYTTPGSMRVNDYPHFNFCLQGRRFQTDSSGKKIQLPTSEYHYSVGKGDHRHRHVNNGAWDSVNKWQDLPKNAPYWTLCQKLEALLTIVTF